MMGHKTCFYGEEQIIIPKLFQLPALCHLHNLLCCLLQKSLADISAVCVANIKPKNSNYMYPGKTAYKIWSWEIYIQQGSECMDIGWSEFTVHSYNRLFMKAQLI